MGLFSKGELKLLWPFYLEGLIVCSFLILIPFQILYFISIGLSMTQVGILSSVMMLAALLFEIPTGAVADIYGRKFSVILGWTLEALMISLIFFANSYFYLLILCFFWGISRTFSSGSYDAWVVDLLKAKRKKSLIPIFFSKHLSIYNLGFVLSGIIGTFCVATFGLSSIWLFSGVACVMGALIICFGEEIYEKPKVKIKESFARLWNQTKESSYYSYKHHVLYFIFLIFFIIAIAASFEGFISWTPLLKNLGFEDAYFGYLFTVMAIIGVGAPLLANKFMKSNNEKKLLVISAMITLVYGFLILISNNLILTIIVLMIGTTIWAFEVPIIQTYFQRFIPTKKRATIGSIGGMISSLALIIGTPIAGFLIDSLGPKLAIFIAALLSIPVIILYNRINEKKSK